MIVLGDFNDAKIDWASYSTKNSNYKFHETTRDCFFQQYVKNSIRDSNSDNPSLLDLVMSNTNNVSLLPPLGKSDHSTVEVLVNYSSNNSTDKVYLDYNNTDFDSMRKVFNDEFNVILKNFADVNDQLSNLSYFKTPNIVRESFIPRKKCFINSRNHIKLDKTAKAKLRKKQRLWKQYLKTKDTKTYTDFRRTSNQLRRLTRKSIKEKERNISDQAKTNRKCFWKYANRKRKYKVPIPNLYKCKAESKDLVGTDTGKTEKFTRESNTEWDIPDPIKANNNISGVFSKNIVLIKKLQNLV